MDRTTLLSLAETYGTPLYVFDLDAFHARIDAVRRALDDRISLCFSMKANPFLASALPACIDALEVCSPGELAICRALELDPARIVCSGVSKTSADVEDALALGVGVCTAESPRQLALIEAACARRERRAAVLLRLSGGDQFGMDERTVTELLSSRDRYPHVDFAGLHFFSGTQKRAARRVCDELSHLCEFAAALEKNCHYKVRRLQYGPGLSVDYFDPDPVENARALLAAVAPHLSRAAGSFSLCVEMGRFFAAPCGTYLTRAADAKVSNGTRYVILDGGSHQLNYDGRLLAQGAPPVRALHDAPPAVQTLCGSLCSRGDVLAGKVLLPLLAPGDVAAFELAGAYSVTEGMALFLSRDLPAVVSYSKERAAVLLRSAGETAAFNTPGGQQYE